jgi:hypothetical protein
VPLARAVVDDPHELVAQDAAEAHVPLQHLEVGAADPRERHAYQRAVVRSLGGRDVGDAGGAAVEVKGAHRLWHSAQRL